MKRVSQPLHHVTLLLELLSFGLDGCSSTVDLLLGSLEAIGTTLEKPWSILLLHHQQLDYSLSSQENTLLDKTKIIDLTSEHLQTVSWLVASQLQLHVLQLHLGLPLLSVSLDPLFILLLVSSWSGSKLMILLKPSRYMDAAACGELLPFLFSTRPKVPFLMLILKMFKNSLGCNS